MKSVATTIINEATFSDDIRHRYALKKVWNDKRPLFSKPTPDDGKGFS